MQNNNWSPDIHWKTDIWRIPRQGINVILYDGELSVDPLFVIKTNKQTKNLGLGLVEAFHTPYIYIYVYYMLPERCWKTLVGMKLMLLNHVTEAEQAEHAVKDCIYCTWFTCWNPNMSEININAVCDELHIYLAMPHVAVLKSLLQSSFHEFLHTVKPVINKLNR